MEKQYRAIHRHVRNPEKFDVIDLFDAIGRSKRLTINDEKDESTFVSIVGNALSKNKTPTMLYGKHVESMFAYMVASLGKCALVKKEDSGDVFTDDSTIIIPDYRVVLSDGMQMLVEVKNYYQKDCFEDYSVNTEYLCGLLKYADLLQTDLKVALYWSKWNLWTLLSPSDFEKEGKKSTISFSTAMKRNQMSILGDVIIGTKQPLSLKLFADRNQPHSIEESGTVNFVVGSAQLLCDNVLILDRIEQRIAYALILFGDWEESSTVSIVPTTKSEIDHVAFSYAPSPEDVNQGFNIVGTLSTVISRQYAHFTAPEGAIEQISPDIDPGILGFIIPENYKGSVLPLWRIHQKPNPD